MPRFDANGMNCVCVAVVVVMGFELESEDDNTLFGSFPIISKKCLGLFF